MRHDREIFERYHFHIHWTKKDQLDWEGFDTRAEAIQRALQLADRGEMFAIEGFYSMCSMCLLIATAT
jgi:hypothetical protein